MEEYESLGDFLEHVSLVMDNEASADEAKVTMMTIHGAKGLEFEHVFLAGWEEGVFPSQRSLDEGGLASLEEERRLAYVAITRARASCTIMHAANRRIYGQWTSSIPSRFIGELPAEHIEEESSLTGGASLWRAGLSERDDPFAHIARDPERAGAARPRLAARGAGARRFQHHAATRGRSAVTSAISLGNAGRTDVQVGTRVFHQKFGYGLVAEKEGNKLEIDFETGGRKRVIDSFVSLG